MDIGEIAEGARRGRQGGHVGAREAHIYRQRNSSEASLPKEKTEVS